VGVPVGTGVEVKPEGVTLTVGTGVEETTELVGTDEEEEYPQAGAQGGGWKR
jgi:hypothetical protein